jgi:monoamine oxidase
MFTVYFNLLPSKKINILFAVLLIWGNQQVYSQTTQSFDIVVYGGTSAGISSAIQSSRLGKKVILIEPTNRIGGLTTGGLGQTDIGNKQAIGGISREFYQNVKSYYQKPENWNWQKRETYRDGGQTTSASHEDAMWTFEPSAALKIYKDMLSKEKYYPSLFSALKPENRGQKNCWKNIIHSNGKRSDLHGQNVH